MKQIARATVLVFVALMMTFGVVGCNKGKVKTEDAFIEKWRRIAQQSQGTSPSVMENPDTDDRNLDDREGWMDIDSLMDEMPVEKPLPRIPISLEMRRANLVAVLAALSKAANVSIMISPNVSGVVTVNVQKQPWNQVFNGVLKTNGLGYSWEGRILRVKTLEDMQHDIELIATKARELVQKQLTLRSEPRVTRVIQLRYTTATRATFIISRVIFGQATEYEREEEGVEGLDVQKSVTEELTLEQQEDGTGLGENTIYNVPGRVVADRDSNSIVVHAPRTLMKLVYYLVRKLDKPRSQVRLKAYIIETDSDTARELGVRWGGLQQGPADGTNNLWFAPSGVGNVDTYQQYGFNQTVTRNSNPGVPTYVNSGPQTGLANYFFGPGMSGQGMFSNLPLTPETIAAGTFQSMTFMYGAIGENILELQLSALQDDNKVKILSSPSITTLDGKEAVTEDGFEVPFITIDQDGNRVVHWRDAVLSLRIKPQVLGEKYLRMEITIKKDEVDFTQGVEGNPLIVKKKTESTLVCRTGETIVISGLVKKQARDAEDGLPYAMDLPLVGWLFKHQLKSEEQQEVLIFITPRILDVWTPEKRQKSFKQIEKEMREDGIVDKNNLTPIEID